MDGQFKFIWKDKNVKSLLLNKIFSEITGIELYSATCYCLANLPDGSGSQVPSKNAARSTSLRKHIPKSFLICRWLSSTFEPYRHQCKKIAGRIISALGGVFFGHSYLLSRGKMRWLKAQALSYPLQGIGPSTPGTFYASNWCNTALSVQAYAVLQREGSWTGELENNPYQPTRWDTGTGKREQKFLVLFHS